MQRLFTLLVLLVAVALPFMPASATGSTTLFNDVNSDAYGLRVTFTEPVSIVRMGEGFARWEAEENGKTIVFFEGKIGTWGDFFFFWEPVDVQLVSHQWQRVPPTPGDEAEISQTPQVDPGTLQIGRVVKVTRSKSSLPYTYYYYVPRTADRSSTATLMHMATASTPLNSLDEADRWAQGQLDHFIRGPLAESSGLIMFTVAVPQMIIGNYKSGCANRLIRNNFERRRSEGIYYRPDLHFIRVLEHFRAALEAAGFQIDSQIFVTGFSTGGVWAHRFALLHPSLVKGVACGGTGGYTMPVESYQGTPLPYSLGIQDLPQLGLGQFDLESFRGIPFFVFIGDKDTNDTLVRGRESGSSRFDKSVEQIVWYLNAFGDSLQERSLAFHEELIKLGMDSTFNEYKGVGHALTAQMKNDVMEFFLNIVDSGDPSGIPDMNSEPSVSNRNTPECDGKAGSDWETPMFVSTDALGDASHPAEDITALYLCTDETYLHVQLALAAAAQPSIRYSVSLHPAESSECYSLHAGGEGMHGPRGFICEIEYAIGEVVEFAVPLDVLRELGLTVFTVSADSRAFGASWADRYDDIQRKDFRLD